MSAKPLEQIIVFSSAALDQPFRPQQVHSKTIHSAIQVERELLNSTASTLWIPFNTRDFSQSLVELSHKPETFNKILSKGNKLPLLFMFEALDGAISNIVANIFRKVIIRENKPSFLTKDEVRAVLCSSRRDEMIIGGAINLDLEILTLIKGDMSILVVPLEVFGPTSNGVAPDFSRFSVVDNGNTLSFGEYEAAVDAILYETDVNYRKNLKRKRTENERSFGASLRRLRHMKDLNQSDFEPEVSEKTIRRVEGSGTRPSDAIVAKIAKRLKISADDIESY